MNQYIVRRLLQAIPLLIGISFVSFLIVMLAPGDPLNAMYPDYILRQMDQEEIREQMGLNDPLVIQYGRMMKNLFTGELNSFIEKRPVVDMIVEKFPPTIIIALLSLIVTIGVAIPVAIFSAIFRESWIDNIVDVATLLGISTPGFMIALVLLLFFSERWHLLPSSGIRPIGSTEYNLIEMVPYLVMPVFVASMIMVPGLVRYARAGMLDVMKEDYIRTARSKGLSERLITLRHALRNALLPSVAQIGLLIPMLLGGSVIGETIFGIPGLGRLAVKSALSRDYPVILTINLYAAVLIVLFGILTDMAYSILDPRIRQG